MSLTIATFAVMAGAFESPLITTESAAQMENILYLDVRKSEDFAATHISGATNVDVNTLSENRDEVSGVLRPIDQVLPILRQAGVDPSRYIVVYAGMDRGGEITLATRMFWILEYLGYENVAVLDGGLKKWQAEGRAVESGASKIKPLGSLELRPDESRIATAAEVREAIDSGKAELQDNRPDGQYSGADKSGAVARAGHLPGAKNVPASSLINEDGLFKPVKELQSLSNGETPVITYCNTGRSATVGYFVERVLGRDVSMYDGSMSEWTRDANNPAIIEESSKKE